MRPSSEIIATCLSCVQVRAGSMCQREQLTSTRSNTIMNGRNVACVSIKSGKVALQIGVQLMQNVGTIRVQAPDPNLTIWIDMEGSNLRLIDSRTHLEIVRSSQLRKARGCASFYFQPESVVEFNQSFGCDIDLGSPIHTSNTDVLNVC